MSNQSQAVSKALSPDELRAKIALTGNLVGLTDPERWEYYKAYCAHLGLDPITRPFDLLSRFESAPDERGGKVEKVTLYANVSCSTQIADKREVSYGRPIIEALPVPGQYLVWVAAKLPNGREMWGEGVVDVVAHKGGKGLENAWKRASTQAHRRATLRLCGIAMPDESELDDIAGAEVIRIEPQARAEDIIDAMPTSKELFDEPRPLVDAPLPAAWTADSPAREIADQEIANKIGAELKEIHDEIKAEAPAPDPQPDPMPERIAQAREKNMPTPTPPTPNRGPARRKHGPEIGERLDKACAALTARGVKGVEMLAEVNAYLDTNGRPQVATRYALDEISATEVCEVFEKWIEVTDRKAREALGKS